MTVAYEAAAAFAFEAAKFYDRRERHYPDDTDGEGGDTDAYKLMRLLVPVAKYKTGELAVETTSYAMEVRGGDGYVREQVTERLFRDAQVLPIWEGTSNILSLDVIRALETLDAHEALFPYLEARLDAPEHPLLVDLAEALEGRYDALQGALLDLAAAPDDAVQYHAKRLSDLLYDVVTAAILLEEAQIQLDEADDARKALVARWFVRDRFEATDAYGIDGETTPGDEYFDVIARYGSLAPADLTEAPTAAD